MSARMCPYLVSATSLSGPTVLRGVWADRTPYNGLVGENKDISCSSKIDYHAFYYYFSDFMCGIMVGRNPMFLKLCDLAPVGHQLPIDQPIQVAHQSHEGRQAYEALTDNAAPDNR